MTEQHFNFDPSLANYDVYRLINISQNNIIVGAGSSKDMDRMKKYFAKNSKDKFKVEFFKKARA